ncbi:MAG: host attachment protein [Candidatus Competibacteraceae bacterium]
MPNITWVVVADSSRARIFKAETALGPLQELAALAHPEARLHAQDLTSDLPGRSFDSSGQGGRHAMEQNLDPKENEALKFARQIAEYLEDGQNENRFAKLVLVAAPKFLGHLRQSMSDRVAALVSQEIDKNLVQQTVEDIRRHLPERL